MNILTDDQHESLTRFASIASSECELQVLRLNIRGTRSRPVIEIILDGKRDVQVIDCEHVSRRVQEQLDAMFNQEINYRLDVTSPGTDEPLIHDFQFERNIGRNIEIYLHNDSQKSGALARVVSDAIVILTKSTKSKQGTQEEIVRSDIKKARVVARF